MTSLSLRLVPPPTVTTTLTASGSIPNGAAPGAIVGAVNTSLTGAAISLSASGGMAATTSGSSLVAGTRAPDIMYRRSVTLGLLASVSAGALGAGLPSVTLGQSVTLPVIEVGSPTLTVTRAGGALSAVEFNKPLTPLDVISVSGGTGPYRFSVITDGSKLECASLTDTTGQLYLTGWTDSLVSNTESGRVRVCDVNGAYGYLDVTVAITAFTPSLISGLVTFDAANVATTGSTATGLTATQGATNFAMVVPAGATAPTVSSVTCPDGAARPVITHPDAITPGFACGPGYASSSTTLGPLFSQANIAGAVGTLISVASFTNSAAYRNVLAIYNSTAGGTWAPNTVQGLTVGTGGDGTLAAMGSPNGGTHGNTATAGLAPNSWQVMTNLSDGYQVVIESNQASWSHYQPSSIAPGNNAANLALPQTNTMTCDSVRIGGGFAPTQPFSWMVHFAAPRALTRNERYQLYAWIARKYPVPAFVPPVRKLVSGMAPHITEDFKTFLWGDRWGTETYTETIPCGALNDEYGVYVQESFPNIAATFPEKSAAYDPARGALQLYYRALNTAQSTFLAGRPSSELTHPSTYYTGRSVGIRSRKRLAQHQGYFEASAKGPLGAGFWYCFWLFAEINQGGLEYDSGEGGAQQPTVTSFSLHRNDGSTDGVTVSCDNLSTQFNLFGVDWYDGGDGFHYFQPYLNREPMGPPQAVESYNAIKALTFMFDITSGIYGPLDSYAIAKLPVAYEVQWMRTYAYPTNAGQPPNVLKKPVLSGTRGNGNTITATPAVFDWSGATSTYQWYTFDPVNGEVAIGGATALTLADATAYLGKTLIFEHTNTNSYWPLNPTISRQYLDPTTTANLTLAASSFSHTMAPGAVLTTISPGPLGAAVTITSSDVTGYFAVSADGRQLLAGASYPAAGTYSLHLTTTPRFGGPVNNQTISITLT
jgi:hypothetical protein